MRKNWTKEQEDWLISNYNKIEVMNMPPIYNKTFQPERSYKSIQKKVERLQLAGKLPKKREYTCDKKSQEELRQTEQSSVRRRWHEKIKYIQEYKESKGCCICGIRYPEVLDMHHIDPLTKSFVLSDAGSRGWEKVKEEIAKCVVICANHHRMFHAGLIELPK